MHDRGGAVIGPGGEDDARVLAQVATADGVLVDGRAQAAVDELGVHRRGVRAPFGPLVAIAFKRMPFQKVTNSTALMRRSEWSKVSRTALPAVARPRSSAPGSGQRRSRPRRGILGVVAPGVMGWAAGGVEVVVMHRS